MDEVFKERMSRFPNKFFFTMAMSPCDDIFSIDEDFEDTKQALHPCLLPKATLVATNGRKRKGVDPGVAAVGTPQRGRAWRERDSILLMQAYAWVEETKKGTTFFNHHVLMKETGSCSRFKRPTSTNVGCPSAPKTIELRPW